MYKQINILVRVDVNDSNDPVLINTMAVELTNAVVASIRQGVSDSQKVNGYQTVEKRILRLEIDAAKFDVAGRTVKDSAADALIYCLSQTLKKLGADYAQNA